MRDEEPRGGDGEPAVLVVDDDEALLHFVAVLLRKDGFGVTPVTSAESALARLEAGERYSLVLTDIRLPGMTGVELLVEIRRRDPEMPVMLMTAHGSIEDAVAAMQRGATDYVSKPLRADDVLHRVRQGLKLKHLEVENRWLHAELASSYRPDRMVATSAAMRALVATVAKVAASDATVLVMGESGTGKELVARALHFGGPRAAGPFVALNCAALPANLVESELFGHAKGSFTGAIRDHGGKLEAANQGTLFLDEIGEMPIEIQPKLLRVLQERSFTRVGEHRLRKIDVRVVAATNRDLGQAMRDGLFREDLFYRLAVVPLTVPPLRERPEDIGPLCRFLLRQIAGDDAPDVTDEALRVLERMPWRGNVRELQNLLERVLTLHDEGPIDVAQLPTESPLGLKSSVAASPRTAEVAPPPSPNPNWVQLPVGGAPLDEMIQQLVQQALEQKNWNQSAAARLLRIPRHILQYRIAKYGIVRR